jgi:hypothetical protein
VALHDANVLSGLAGWLTNEDRRARGNPAFIFAEMGDDRGFEVMEGSVENRT